MRFRIDYIAVDRRAIIFARQLDPGTFDIGPTLRLGGALVDGVTTVRAVKPDGTPDPGAFAFQLKDRRQAGLFVRGQVVTLDSDPAVGENKAPRAK